MTLKDLAGKKWPEPHALLPVSNIKNYVQCHDCGWHGEGNCPHNKLLSDLAEIPVEWDVEKAAHKIADVLEEDFAKKPSQMSYNIADALIVELPKYMLKKPDND
jgi:hypothetical protein